VHAATAEAGGAAGLHKHIEAEGEEKDAERHGDDMGVKINKDEAPEGELMHGMMDHLMRAAKVAEYAFMMGGHGDVAETVQGLPPWLHVDQEDKSVEVSHEPRE
jgi:hypothetical protein